jgi:HEPN domain-containing protein
MPKPRSSPDNVEARRYLRAALQRFEEAEFLLERGGYTTAASYLAGYAVECALKAMILWHEPPSRHLATLRKFRGVRAHDFDSLKARLVRRKVVVPSAIARELARVNWWSTDLRYETRRTRRQDAKGFLIATERILEWARGSF